MANCDLIKFDVTQDCKDCAIKSLYGIFSNKPGEKGIQRRRSSYVWKTPEKSFEKYNFKATDLTPG